MHLKFHETISNGYQVKACARLIYTKRPQNYQGGVIPKGI